MKRKDYHPSVSVTSRDGKRIVKLPVRERRILDNAKDLLRELSTLGDGNTQKHATAARDGLVKVMAELDGTPLLAGQEEKQEGGAR